jgi:GNAT superfamily N-acetyltransferase
MMPQESNRSARIEARIAPDVLAVVKRAAEIQGRSVSEFLVSAAQDAANRTIEKTEIIQLSRLRGSTHQSSCAVCGSERGVCRSSSPYRRGSVTPFVTQAFDRTYDRSTFSSGVDALDRYFRELAVQDIKRRVAGCFVALDEANEVAGFYTLAATSVPFASLPADMTKRLPRYPVVPAMLMGRLAVATKHQGKGLGRALIADALIRTDGFGIGAFALIVDAKDEQAMHFYKANGFASIPDEARRMFLPIATALQAMANKTI